jgi:hypothetical protein
MSPKYPGNKAFNSLRWIGCDVIFIFAYFGGKITKKSKIQIEKSETEKYDLTGTFGRFSMVSVDDFGAELFG